MGNPRAPFFDVQLRSHVVWENMTVDAACEFDSHIFPNNMRSQLDIKEWSTWITFSNHLWFNKWEFFWSSWFSLLFFWFFKTSTISLSSSSSKLIFVWLLVFFIICFVCFAVGTTA